MPLPNRTPFPRWFLLIAVATVWGTIIISPRAWAQEFPASAAYYSRINTYGFSFGFSNDSSHILLGLAQRRKLLNIGFEYDRRLRAGPHVNWQYSFEVMPVALEGDPMTRVVVTQTEPTPATYTYSMAPEVNCGRMSETYAEESTDGFIYSGTETAQCAGRRWTLGVAISPVGFEWNFIPERRLQPFFSAHAGSMFSRQAIPVLSAGARNFTFATGAGVEFFLTARRSIRAEFRVHHISNADTAKLNPGIDNGVFRLAFCFGH